LSRLIFVPQFPTKLRYQEFWFWEFPKQFKNYFDEVITLGAITKYNFEKKQDRDQAMFSSIDQSILFECEQVKEYLNLSKKEDDVLFLADLSFTGLFANVLFHYPMKRTYVFCHATSLNNLDYFEKCRRSKYLVEAGHAALFNKVFVGSEYHQNKLQHTGYFKNTVVTYLPKPPFTFFDSFKNVDKEFDIVSVARQTPQKVDFNLEKKIEEKFGQIKRPGSFDAFIQYYSFLSRSKILLITSQEDTFNYTVVDAIMSGCIPLAPKKFAFSELLSDEYLYSNQDELEEKIKYYLVNYKVIPTLKCEIECNTFYDKICEVMKENK
jgi:hypothetical protein